jgi:hypothetical protein
MMVLTISLKREEYMKKIIIGLIGLTSISAFALPTDYTCSLIEADGNKVATASALISRAHYDAGIIKSGDSILLGVANNFGYRLEVSLYNNTKRKVIGTKTIELAGPGYIDGNPSKGERSLKNPMEINLEFSSGLSVNCLRADNIEYPRD